MDDIILTRSDKEALTETKKLPRAILCEYRYGKVKVLRIEIVYQKHGLLSQRKYVLHLLEKAGVLGCKLASTPIKSDVDFWSNTVYENVKDDRKMIWKLIHLTITRPKDLLRCCLLKLIQV